MSFGGMLVGGAILSWIIKLVFILLVIGLIVGAIILIIRAVKKDTKPVVCMQCGATNTKDAMFCAACGAELRK